MATRYPIQIDTSSVELPTVADNFTAVNAEAINRLRDAILAIETELGVKPSAIYATVRARLDAMEDELDTLETEFTEFVSGSGGGIGGSNTDVLFNDNGLFGGSSTFRFNKTTAQIILGDSASIAYGTNTAQRGFFRLKNNSEIVFRSSDNTKDLTSISSLLASSLNVLNIGTDITSTASRTFDKVVLTANNTIEITSSLGTSTLIVNPTFVDIANNKNFALIGNPISEPPTFGGGAGVIFTRNALTNPSTNPTNGIILYTDATDNYLKYRKTTGEVIVLDGNPYHTTYLTQTDWYINPSTGNDNNVGTSSGVALKTFAELKRRWGVGGTLTPSSGNTVIIHLLGDMPSSDPLSFVNITLGTDVNLIVKGQTTTIRGGNLTAITSLNRTINQPWEITDSIMTGNWTTDLGQRIRIIGGSHAGAVAWVAKDLGAKTARTSSFALPPTVPDVSTHITPSLISVSDAYLLESLTKVYLGESVGSGEGAWATYTTYSPAIYFVDLDIQVGITQTSLVIGSGVDKAFINCNISSSVSFAGSVSLSLSNCCMRSDFFTSGGGFATVEAGLFLTPAEQIVIGPGTTLILDGDVMSEGASYIAQGGTIQIGLACAFDAINLGAAFSNGSGLSIGAPDAQIGGTVSLHDINFGSHALWGSGNDGYGIYIDALGKFVYKTTAPSITGTFGDFTLGGRLTSRAWNEANRSYTLMIDNTWSNLGLSIAAGGFDGNAHNVEKGSLLIKGSVELNEIPDHTDGYDGYDGYTEITPETTAKWFDTEETSPFAAIPDTFVKARRRQVQTTTSAINQIIDDGGLYGIEDFSISPSSVVIIDATLFAKIHGSAEAGSIRLSGTFYRNGSSAPVNVGTDDNIFKLSSGLIGTTAEFHINTVNNTIEIRVSPGGSYIIDWRWIRVQYEGLS